MAWRLAWLLEAVANRYDMIFYFFVGKASDAAAGVTHAASPMDRTTGKGKPFGCTILLILMAVRLRPHLTTATAASSCTIL